MFYRPPPNRRSNYGDPDAQARLDAIQYIADMYE